MATRTIPFIDIPASALPSKNITDSMRALLAMAIHMNDDFEAVDTAGLVRKSVFLPPVLEAQVQRIADKHGLSFSDAVAAMAARALDSVLIKREEMQEVRTLVDVPFPARAGQDIFYKSIMGSLSQNRICLAEASTGIGKSRSMIAAAITSAQSGKRPVVVAAPTLAILGGSLWKEYEALQQMGVGVGIKARFFPGASEFVDAQRLEDHINEAIFLGEPVDAAVKEWVDAGGPMITQLPLAGAMQSGGHTMRWLMSDLKDLATELDPTAFAFKSGGSADIDALLKAVRLDAFDADIIFCTHAMLTMAHRGSWEWFPKPSILMIDEAHQFETIVASVSSDNLSLHAFRSSVRAARKANGHSNKSAAGKLESAVGDLIQSARNLDVTGATVRLNAYTGSSNLDFMRAVQKMALCLKSKELKDVARVSEARTAIAMLINALEGQPNSFGSIQYSPDRRFPSILVGKRSVASLIGSLWNEASGGVVLASATLSTPDEFGNSKFDYAASLLALPLLRLDTPQPVIAPWTTSIPTIHLPSAPDQLSRPLRVIRTDALEAQWLENLAEQVMCVADQALGGTLVLLTSYAQVKLMAQALTALGLSTRLISQDPNEKFANCEARFRAAHQAQLRPVLLGLGVAWTGVDLTDKSVPAKNDRLLTDLIVGCLPVGLNKTSTMAARVAIQNTNPIIKEALMILRQGMGRLIRSSEAVGKHIWIMDGRLWSNWPGMQPLQKSARRLLEQYPNREVF